MMWVTVWVVDLNFSPPYTIFRANENPGGLDSPGFLLYTIRDSNPRHPD